MKFLFEENYNRVDLVGFALGMTLIVNNQTLWGLIVMISASLISGIGEEYL